MVCHDGSNASDSAMQTIAAGFLREKVDTLFVANAWSLEKEEYLPYDQKLNYIREHTSAKFIHLQDKFQFIDE